MTPDALPIFGVQTAIESEPGEWTIGTLAADLDADPDAVRAIVEAMIHADRVERDARGYLSPASPAPELSALQRRVLAIITAHPGVYGIQIIEAARSTTTATYAALGALRRKGLIVSRRGTILATGGARGVVRYVVAPVEPRPAPLPLDLDWIARRARDLALGRERPEEARPAGLGIRPRAERREGVGRGD